MFFILVIQFTNFSNFEPMFITRISFLFLLISFSFVAQQVIPTKRELLWEISRTSKDPKSYLFGTIHSNDKRVFAFSDSLYVALNNSEMIVLETDIMKLFEKLDTRKYIPSTLYDKHGRPYTGTNEASTTFYGSENGMPQFLDAYFETYCFNAKKSFFALESLDNQINYLQDFPIKEGDLINSELMNFTQEKLMELYLNGDIEALNRFVKVNLSVHENAYENLITKRNHKMATTIDSLLKTNKKMFCAVGSGHLAGSDGLIRLLRSKGYRLRPISWTVSEYPQKAKMEVKSKNEYVYFHEESHLVAKFPGKPLVRMNQDNSVTIKYRDLGQGNTYQIDIQPMDSSLTLEEIASIYIASPTNSHYRKIILDDGTETFEGISDTYPEGLNWVRIIFGLNYFAVIKTYGGNKFMHSNRPRIFFNQVWFE